MNLARFSAQAERRLREVHSDEVDPDGTGFVHLPTEYLEVLQAWDPRDLPQRHSDLSEEQSVAYVERHFMLLGVPAERVARATRRLSVADLDVAELVPAKYARVRSVDACRLPDRVCRPQPGGRGNEHFGQCG